MRCFLTLFQSGINPILILIVVIDASLVLKDTTISGMRLATCVLLDLCLCPVFIVA